MKPGIAAILVVVSMGAGCTQQVRKTEPEAAVENPFFERWETPFGVPPFGRIENAHYLPGFHEALARHKQEIATITGSAEAPGFSNTVEALAESGDLLGKVRKVFFSQLSAHTSDELNAIAEKVAPMLAKHKDDILLDEKLFARLKAVYEKRQSLKLTTEQATLLDELYQDFVRGGADLSAEKQAELRGINEALSLTTLAFGQNILKENNKFEMVLESRTDLAGLPDRVVAAAENAAEERGQKGKWVFTLHKPSLIPFLQFSGKRSLREKMFKGYITRGAHGDPLDNKGNIQKIVALRTRKAALLGYDNYAAFALSRRMAKTSGKVDELLTRLWAAALPVAKREVAALQALIDQEGGKFKLAPWDWWYYAERLRKAEYDLDENELRPYFKLENVQQGAFAVAGKLYGLTFHERSDIPRYHPEVKTYEVREADGSHRGVLYMDFHPRASKRGGAWCGAYREPHRKAGERIAPVVTNVCNFSAPAGDKPALLSFDEVLTLFHEFGHALHVLLNDTTYERIADAVRVDFVELPSQIMENWATEPEVLRMYAKHYQTRAPIPDALIDKIVKSRHFNQGFETVEYLAASLLDMDWHTAAVAEGVDVDAFEKKALDEIGLIPEIVSRYKSPYFRHIFASSYYAAGYYSYIWAAVLDADAFEAFKQVGLFDQQTARSFRENILSRGGAEDPMTLYKRFRGAEPKIEPLLRSKGMIPEKSP